MYVCVCFELGLNESNFINQIKKKHFLKYSWLYMNLENKSSGRVKYNIVV